MCIVCHYFQDVAHESNDSSHFMFRNSEEFVKLKFCIDQNSMDFADSGVYLYYLIAVGKHHILYIVGNFVIDDACIFCPPACARMCLYDFCRYLRGSPAKPCEHQRSYLSPGAGLIYCASMPIQVWCAQNCINIICKA